MIGLNGAHFANSLGEEWIAPGGCGLHRGSSTAIREASAEHEAPSRMKCASAAGVLALGDDAACGGCARHNLPVMRIPSLYSGYGAPEK